MATKNEKSGRSVFLDTTSAQAQLDKLNLKIDAYDKQLKQVNLTQKEIVSLQKSRAETAEKAATVQLQIEKGIGVTLIQQRKYIQDLNKDLSKLADGTKEWVEKAKQISQANDRLAEMKKRLNDISGAQQDVSKSSSFFGSFFGNIGANLFTSASSFITSFFTGAREEFEQADLAIRNLMNDLENFGDLDALPKLTKQSSDLADKFKFLDNDTITEAQSKLVTYGKLTTTEIQKLIPVIIDYAAKTRKQLPEATEVFVKALDGAGKGLKGYATGIKDTNGIAQNFSIIMEQVGKRVEGAAETFGESSQGRIAKWTQFINNAKEKFGEFINTIISAPKSANELFDEAKLKVENYNNSLDPLLAKYDELKGKTTLNKDEQILLEGIIQKIVQIVPTAATEFDKYGTALDINKDKVIAFRKENDKFLQTREKSAIDEQLKEANKTVGVIELFVNNRKLLLENFKKFNIEEKEQQSQLAKIDETIARTQEKLITQTNILIDKYKVELPQGLNAFREAALKLKFGVDQATTATTTESDADKKVREQREAEEKKKREEEEEKNKKKREAAAQKAAAEAKKRADDLKQLNDELRKLNQLTPDISPLDKEVVELDEKFIKLKELAHGNRDELKKIDLAYYDELFKITLKYSRLEQEEFEKKIKAREKASQELVNRIISRPLLTGTNDRLDSAITDQKDKDRRTKSAQLELDAIKASGKKRLEAELAILDEKEKQELANEKLTQAERDLIQEQYNQARLQKETDYWAAVAQQALDFIQQSLNIFKIFSDAKTDQENRDLARIQTGNEKNKRAYQNLLNGKLISTQEYNRRVLADEEKLAQKTEEIKKAQFERQKKQDIEQALVNGALAITSTLAAKPGPLDILSLGTMRLIQLGLTIAATAAQVATISKRKYEDGGFIPEGPSHKEKGIKLVDGKTGQVRGEVEGGEPILSKKTYANNKPVVDALLRSSMYAGGKTIQPFYKNTPYKSIDVMGISRSIQKVRHYESGGILPSTVTTPQTTEAQPIIIPAMSDEQTAVMKAVLELFSKPIEAVVQYGSIKTAKAKDDSIRNDAIFRKQSG